MVIPSIHMVPPIHHRANRRRERPGSRARRAVARKGNIQAELSEGLLDARDNSIYLPSDRPHPSPLLRQSFDQSWQRWRAREADQTRKAMSTNMELIVEEQQRMFGEDNDDDLSFDLKPAMLDVVVRLFGDIDYTDP